MSTMERARGKTTEALVRPHGLVILVGDFGSGKTEVAVNLALHLAAVPDQGEIAIADLDLVNPYFRTREACAPLEQAGVRVVMPRGGHQHADLPILLPEVKGLLQNDETTVILDVGGDTMGSRVLAALADGMPVDYDFWFVVNKNRPFHDTPERCIETIRRIEGASHLQITGVVANTHLIEETTIEMITGGVTLTEAVAAQLGVQVAFVAAMSPLADDLRVDHPLLLMNRLMLPPWRSSTERSAFAPAPGR